MQEVQMEDKEVTFSIRREAILNFRGIELKLMRVVSLTSISSNPGTRLSCGMTTYIFVASEIVQKQKK